MSWFELAMWSIGFGFFIILVVLPIVAVVLFTVFDIIFRIDIGISKLFWLLLLAVPGIGLLLYWLVRPKRFNPLLETEDLAPWGARAPVRLELQPEAPVLAAGAEPRKGVEEETFRRAA